MMTICDHCGSDIRWSWTEAFLKFGFMDGDGLIETWEVEGVLVEAGYEVSVATWGMHNCVITSIKKAGVELIPHHDPAVRVGYDDPRCYLPQEIVTLLDQKLPDEPDS